MISVHFQGKAFNITVIKAIKVYAPTSNTEEAETEWFYEDLEDLLELTSKKDVLLIIGDWNAKDLLGLRGRDCPLPFSAADIWERLLLDLQRMVGGLLLKLPSQVLILGLL